MRRSALKRKKPLRNQRPTLRKATLRAWKRGHYGEALALLVRVAKWLKRESFGGFPEADDTIAFVAALKAAPKRRYRKASGKVTVKDLDALVRQIVLLRDGRCLRGPEGCHGALQACHALSKGAHPEMRHDTSNVFAMCEGHHLFRADAWHSTDPGPGQAWFRDHFGDNFLDLLRSISAERKGEKTDKDKCKAKLEQELEGLKKARGVA